MRPIPLMTACVLLLAAGAPTAAAPLSPAGFARVPQLSAIELAQDKPKKDETVKEKVKRVWRNLTGYKFDVACPAFPIPFVINRASCTETGKSRADARAKCQARYPFCQVADAR
jgi:hypothetical protein